MTTWFRHFLATHQPDPDPDSTIDEPTYLVVCHGAFLATFLSVLRSPVFSFTLKPDVDIARKCLNTSVTQIRCQKTASGSGWKGVVESWAEVGHLDGLIEKDLGVADDVASSQHDLARRLGQS